MEIIIKSDNPVSIIEAFRMKNFDPESFGSLDGYAEWLAASLWKFQSVGLAEPLDGKSTEEKCRILVDAMVKNKLIKLVD